MKLIKVSVSKEQLALVPRNERLFFIVLGAFLNDLGMFQKLMLFSTNVATSNELVQVAQNLQTMNLARFLTGILWEGWQLLGKYFFGTGLSKEYEPRLGKSARASLANLKQYFGSKEGNWMSSARSRFGFHYPSSDEVAGLLEDMASSDELEIYVSEFFGNCVFRGAGVLLCCGILNSTGEATTNAQMGKWLKDVRRVAKWFGEFLGECLVLVAKIQPGSPPEVIQIPEPPSLDEIILPYFINASKAHRRSTSATR